MPAAAFAKNDPGALGELQHNQQESAPRSPPPARKSRDYSAKPAWANISLRPTMDRDAGHGSPAKSIRTNFAGLLSRPKSLRNLYKQGKEDELKAKDKENTCPETPIFAQFASTADTVLDGDGAKVKDRPKSLQVPKSPFAETTSRHSSEMDASAKPSRKTGVLGAFGGLTHARARQAPLGLAEGEKMLSPSDINKQLEDLLDRRNIPENQRYKMRNLNDVIKMEFIRQDWAEMKAAKMTMTGNSNNSTTTTTSGGTSGSSSTGDYGSVLTSATSPASDCDDDSKTSNNANKTKRSRGRSFTFSRSSGKKESRSRSKKGRGEATLGRHFRSKSTDSVADDRPLSAQSSSGSTSFLAKMKLHQGPGDFVAYLRKVQKPELVEVGKLHKLRLLLRNETVAWIEDFIQQGGMMEIVGLLNRIMEVEWREEHEDALLHENLLCLKALSTTARAMEYLDTVQTDLLPKLLHLLFDPEKKGPSEFTTRNIITSVLLTYIESAPPAERVTRAQTVLAHLRDRQPREEERPVPFVLEMRQERPYQMWCKEVVSVTKEVFWIFLHNLNVVALAKTHQQQPDAQAKTLDEHAYSYMRRHFPPERPPVPAAPYVGGVEWDATNYLASHLDVLNAILACTPTAAQRNALREQMRMSGWERCMGSSLRLCKEKFYGAVHTALRTWVAAAAEDAWEVSAVRFGPAPRSETAAANKSVDAPKLDAPKLDAPKLDVPKLELGLDRQSSKGDGWL
ncbi:hypothetical protein CDD82_4363 [Ophiocordyceps australis]|uniref:Formin GTPase-binding domain-containing protein n=1 Tax=Ophiocordyceps australis TaxID=1399860 RepID=A0A2C5Z8Z2_9HYPO|nr:hypothetical protein CDD82_4363 [Ophiocordyceps australis]